MLLAEMKEESLSQSALMAKHVKQVEQIEFPIFKDFGRVSSECLP